MTQSNIFIQLVKKVLFYKRKFTIFEKTVTFRLLNGRRIQEDTHIYKHMHLLQEVALKEEET